MGLCFLVWYDNKSESVAFVLNSVGNSVPETISHEFLKQSNATSKNLYDNDSWNAQRLLIKLPKIVDCTLWYAMLIKYPSIFFRGWGWGTGTIQYLGVFLQSLCFSHESKQNILSNKVLQKNVWKKAKHSNKNLFVVL